MTQDARTILTEALEQIRRDTGVGITHVRVNWIRTHGDAGGRVGVIEAEAIIGSSDAAE